MDRIIIGNKIRQIRKGNHLSQEEFAFRIGVSRQTVSSWELGQMRPEISKIKAICQLFDVKADELLFDEETEEEVNDVVACKIEDQVCVDEYIEQGVEEKKPDKFWKIVNVVRRVIKYTVVGLISVFLVFCIVVASIIAQSPNNNGDAVVHVYSFCIAHNTGLGLFIAMCILILVGILLKVFLFDKNKIKRGYTK